MPTVVPPMPPPAPLTTRAERPTLGPADHPGRNPEDRAPHPVARLASALAGPRRVRVRVLRREWSA